MIQLLTFIVKAGTLQLLLVLLASFFGPQARNGQAQVFRCRSTPSVLQILQPSQGQNNPSSKSTPLLEALALNWTIPSVSITEVS